MEKDVIEEETEEEVSEEELVEAQDEPEEEKDVEEEVKEEKEEMSFKREMHKAVCAECGKECEVPFKPIESRPVYCGECYSKHRPQRRRF